MKLSIVIPAYNVESYLYEALSSVFSQTVEPSEVIVINDGSTDETLKIAETFYHKHLNYKVYTTRNRGLGLARNYGMEKSSGDYIYFFDSDDVLDARFIERMQEEIKKNENPDLVFFSGESFYDDGYDSGFFPRYERSINQVFATGKDAFKKLNEINGCFSSACLYLAKKSFFDQNKLRFKPILHEDEEILFPLFFLAKKTVVIDEIFFYRRVRRGSIMQSKKTKKNFEGYLSIMESLVEFGKCYPDLVKSNETHWRERGQAMLIASFLLKKGFRISFSDHFSLIKYFFYFANLNTSIKLLFYSTPKSFQNFVQANRRVFRM
ncbi:glycosyltransferase family 2 protein [Halomonas saccharevitans]|uniref:Glycosyltransferase family 2 protein n=1 Tax=Halomonas saccharevitans TaxID=416872 RepID=A0ABU3NCE9_9GAMM|nr:glycosyltransferase family 2 protein [Halomonas saccharevitans]MDT8878310.1 glycosyltransferase family 2 protein [Halomonas saccharevitans]